LFKALADDKDRGTANAAGTDQRTRGTEDTVQSVIGDVGFLHLAFVVEGGWQLVLDV